MILVRVAVDHWVEDGNTPLVRRQSLARHHAHTHSHTHSHLGRVNVTQQIRLVVCVQELGRKQRRSTQINKVLYKRLMKCQCFVLLFNNTLVLDVQANISLGLTKNLNEMIQYQICCKRHCWYSKSLISLYMTIFINRQFPVMDNYLYKHET